MPEKMSHNKTGRAYEYAWIEAVDHVLSPKRKVKKVQNGNLKSNEGKWKGLDESKQKIYLASAETALNKIIDMEPLMLEDGGDELLLECLPDSAGERGDVRDIVISRPSIGWEIGLSIKHNNNDQKHSRLSPQIDFGEKWYGISCSEEYKKETQPIFDKLIKGEKDKTTWKSLVNPQSIIHRPLMTAFMNEIQRAYDKDPSMAKRISEYILGTNDYYKTICWEKYEVTCFETFNMHGTLNARGNGKAPSIVLPVVPFPSKILSLKLVNDTTMVMDMDYGYQFSFRLHNDTAILNPSLKLAIKLLENPSEIRSFRCKWG